MTKTSYNTKAGTAFATGERPQLRPVAGRQTARNRPAPGNSGRGLLAAGETKPTLCWSLEEHGVVDRGSRPTARRELVLVARTASEQGRGEDRVMARH